MTKIIMISISQLNLTTDNKTILDGIDLTVREGEVFGITGLKGSGKTAFLKILATIINPSAGKVKVSGFDIVKERNRVRPMIGYMPDSAVSDSGSTVNEHLDFFLSMYWKKNGEYLHYLDSLLNELDLTHTKDKLLSELSAEEKQKVSLARSVMHNPSLLLLDDPECGMDTTGLESLLSVIKGRSGSGKAVVAASDSISFLNNIAHRIGVLHEGRLIWIFQSGVESRESIERRINELRKGEDESCSD
ncbi:MAG: ABC transporter ATP-binding protein [Nitrospirae bacterium]|nr:ABC transporter ATP-binding protein [Nitrospirota bacterium]